MPRYLVLPEPLPLDKSNYFRLHDAYVTAATPEEALRQKSRTHSYGLVRVIDIDGGQLFEVETKRETIVTAIDESR